MLDRFRDPKDPENHHRDVEAAYRVRCSDPPDDVFGQAPAGSHAAGGHLPDEPPLWRAEDPRPDRRLPRHLDDVAQALKFDEAGVQKAVSNIAELISVLPSALQKCLAYFAGARVR
jgi:hypothetical protein